MGLTHRLARQFGGALCPTMESLHSIGRQGSAATIPERTLELILLGDEPIVVEQMIDEFVVINLAIAVGIVPAGQSATAAREHCTSP